MTTFSETRNFTLKDVMPLYQANQWSASLKPKELYQALQHSHSVITAWDEKELIGLGNAISDGYLVVYYPHLLVHPAHQNHGIGGRIMSLMQEKYQHFHMQILTAENKAINFYKKMGFKKAGNTEPMWIYDGNDH